jgi:hypothetical protein
MEIVRDFLGDISGWRPRCLKAEEELAQERWAKLEYARQLDEAKEKIKQLELLVPHPTPPVITVTYKRDNAWIQQHMDGMNLSIERFQLDAVYTMTNQTNFLNIVAWDWCDTLEYVKELFDCENFAILFKAYVDLYFRLNQVAIILDYKSAHAYNLVIFPDGNMSVLDVEFDGMWVWTKRPVIFYSLEGATALI